VNVAPGGFVIKTSSHRPFTLAVLVLAIVVVTVPAHAQTFSVLYNFGTNAGDPGNAINPGLVAQGRDGSLYSTTYGGGTTGQGAAFKITPTGTISVLYSFNYTNGSQPYSGLTLGADGNFYGTASAGGTSGVGTLFKVTPSGSLTTLYNFVPDPSSPYPDAPPIQGTDGSLYGTTVQGGASGCGTAYKLTASGTFTTLYQFDSTHGCNLYAPLVQGTDGNLYGTTYSGGSALNPAGTVFKLTTAGKLTVLYNFDGTHGGNSFSPLVQGSDGNFYGTTPGGGSSNLGVVFKITSLGKLTVLHDFNGTDGGYPWGAGLVQANDGNFYGVAKEGGTLTYGTIYKITSAGTFSVLYNFDNTHGATPEVTLFQHTNGILYGDTSLGGSSGAGAGVFYSLNEGLKPFVSLLSTTGKVGQTVEILGQGFTGTTNVSFGGTPATFTVSSDTYLTATVPSGAKTGSVTVVTPGGTLTSNKNFRVTPQIKSFSPSSGPVTASVTIKGVSLSQTTAVTFGGVKATSFTVNSDTQVTATVPSGAKTGKIGITTAGGTASSSGTFTVTPAITGFNPTSGPVGTSVTIIGIGFTGATSVKFNGVSATLFTVNSDTNVTAIVPTGATTGPISITTPHGTAKSGTNFTVT
jgi:uncharacterized repeat protein (TIGR03803 family)